MKTLIAALPLLGLGCVFYPPNPYSTASAESELEASEQRILELGLGRPWETPEHEKETFVDADLEAWRDSVLAVADTPTLNHLHKQTTIKLAALRTWEKDLNGQSEFNRIDQLRRVTDQIRIEETRLAMIEEQPYRPRRDD